MHIIRKKKEIKWIFYERLLYVKIEECNTVDKKMASTKTKIKIDPTARKVILNLDS